MTIMSNGVSLTVHPPTGAPIVLDVQGSRLVIDETWSPYIQVELTVKTPALADWARLDPRGANVRGTITAANLISLTADEVTADLVLRDRSKGKTTGTTILGFEGDESLLQDFPFIGSAPFDVGTRYGSSLRALTGYALAQIGAALPDSLTAHDLFSVNLIPNPSSETLEERVEVLRNLVTNPHAAVNANGYASRGSSAINVARLTTKAPVFHYDQLGTIRVQTTSTSAWGLNIMPNRIPVPLNESNLFEASVYVQNGTTLRNMRMSVQWFNEAGVALATQDAGALVAEVAGTWVRVFVRGVIPPGAASALPYLAATAAASGELHYVDCAAFYIVDAPDLGGGGWPAGGGVEALPYIDGYMGSYNPIGLETEWTGVFWESTSVAYRRQPVGYVDPYEAFPELGRYVLAHADGYPDTGVRAGRVTMLEPWYSAGTVPLQGGGTVRSPWFPVTPGDTNEARVSVNPKRTQPFTLRLRYDTGAEHLSPTVTATGGVWTALEIPLHAAVAPAGATMAYIEVECVAGGTPWHSGEWWDFDSFMVTQDLVPLAAREPYFDGDTADAGGYVYSFRGDPGTSVSLRNLASTPVMRPDSAVLTPGQNLWDFLEPLVQRGAYRLFCDEARVWHLVDDSTYSYPGTLEASTGVDILDANDITSRSGDWFDAVVVEYRWTDTEGLSQIAYDTATVPGYTKGVTITYQDTAYPGPGAAASILGRGLAKARTQRVELRPRYEARPGQEATITIDGETIEGRVSSLSHSFPDARMTASIITSEV